MLCDVISCVEHCARLYARVNGLLGMCAGSLLRRDIGEALGENCCCLPYSFVGVTLFTMLLLTSITLLLSFKTTVSMRKCMFLYRISRYWARFAAAQQLSHQLKACGTQCAEPYKRAHVAKTLKHPRVVQFYFIPPE